MKTRDYLGRHRIRSQVIAIAATAAAAGRRDNLGIGKHGDRELVAGAGTTYSRPSVAQVGNSSVIAAQGQKGSLDFYWQTIGAKSWNCEVVNGTAHCK